MKRCKQLVNQQAVFRAVRSNTSVGGVLRVVSINTCPRCTSICACFAPVNLYESYTQVQQWLKDNAESKHAAVYAVVGKDETVNFVGVGRNVALSVAAHLANEGEEMVHFLKVSFPHEI